jgi:hypothetical protein
MRSPLRVPSPCLGPLRIPRGTPCGDPCFHRCPEIASRAQDIRDLKDLPKLIIVDMTGNPLVAAEDYRLYTVYFLRKLKVGAHTHTHTHPWSFPRPVVFFV